MTQTIEVIFDFGSPNAYLALQVLPQLAARTGASIRLVPCLLGGIFKATGNRAPMESFADVKGKLAYDRLEMERFVRRHGLTRFRMNPHFPVNSLLAMRGLIVAQQRGEDARYVVAVCAGFWEDGRKMDEVAEFVDVLDAAGLDGRAIAAATQDPAVKAALAVNTERAVERGVFGIPTFFVGEEMFFGKERLGQIEDYLRGR